jgi:hypothetical protein
MDSTSNIINTDRIQKHFTVRSLGPPTDTTRFLLVPTVWYNEVHLCVSHSEMCKHFICLYHHSKWPRDKFNWKWYSKLLPGNNLSGVDIMKVLLYIIMKTSQDLLDQVIQNMMNDDENYNLFFCKFSQFFSILSLVFLFLREYKK